MNILYGESLKNGNLGTQATHILGVVDSLRKLGHNVVLISEEKRRLDKELDTHRKSLWGYLRDSMLQSKLLRPLRGVGVILYFLLRDTWSFLQVFIILVRKRKRFDVIYRRDHLFNSEYFLARLFKIPLVKEVNGITGDELAISERVGKVVRRIIDRIDRFILPKADKIIVVTSNLRDVLQKEYGVPEKKIVVIPNGTNTELFKPMDTREAKEKISLNQNNRYICFVGAFYTWAGVENIIKSMPQVIKECLDTQFLIVGDGPLKQELSNLGVQLGVSEKLVFTGMVPYQEVPLYINASDVCVCPGDDNFRNKKVGGGSPLKLPEYMSCAKPVVTGSVIGLSREVMDSGAGFTVDMKNADELARVLISLLKDEMLSKKMGENGRKKALEKYSWMKVSEQIIEVCQSLTGGAK